MDLHKMIAELQAEKQRLDEAIQALERLSAGKAGRVRRRGRPPRWLKEEMQQSAAVSSTPGGSEEVQEQPAAGKTKKL